MNDKTTLDDEYRLQKLYEERDFYDSLIKKLENREMNLVSCLNNISEDKAAIMVNLAIIYDQIRRIGFLNKKQYENELNRASIKKTKTLLSRDEDADIDSAFDKSSKNGFFNKIRF